MPQFILIDRLLARVGGHNFQYAVDVLQAAESAGYEVVLGTHNEFQAQDQLPATWQVRPVFRHGWNRRHLLGVDGLRKEAVGIDGYTLPRRRPSRLGDFARRLADWPWRRARQHHIEDFASGCAQLFTEFGFDRSACYFLPTVSDLDLLGLVRFLHRTPGSAEADWHLQFHFDVFSGRRPDYASQERIRETLARQFTAARARVSGHRLHFYATTRQIAEQYNLLRAGDFSHLPYPVNRQFSPAASSTRRRLPLRITCAGAMRREKGKRALRPVLDALSEPLLAAEVQFWMQATAHTARRFLGRRWIRQSQSYARVPAAGCAPIVTLSNSLARDEYVRLIQQSDLGLFLYGSQRYHARCSGVLVEMLAAGKPVIVPAGCWLADQIQESIYQHLDALNQRIPSSGELAVRDAPAAEPSGEVIFEAALEPGTSALLCSFTAGGANDAVRYVQLDANCYANGVRTSWSQRHILSERENGGKIAALLRVNNSAERIRLRFGFAYENAGIQVRNLSVRGMMDGDDLPIGQVGVISSRRADVPVLVRELARHYDHYRATAEAFAGLWCYQHDALRTVEMLDANRRRLKNAAA